ncbi:MAG: hypothetical protein AB9917_04220 [Negativicutes bacterium]
MQFTGVPKPRKEQSGDGPSKIRNTSKADPHWGQAGWNRGKDIPSLQR